MTKDDLCFTCRIFTDEVIRHPETAGASVYVKMS